MKTHFLLIAFFITGIAFGQVTETRESKPFTTLTVDGVAKVIYTHSDVFSVKVEAMEEDMKKIETSYSGNNLQIHTNGRIEHTIKIYVSGNTLQGLNITGAADFQTGNNLSADRFLLEASGASKVHLQLTVIQLNVVTNGASQVALEGKASTIDADVSGAASLKAFELSCDNADVDASGAASAKIVANKKIKAKTSGAASIKYSGSPKDVSTDSTTGSFIKRED